jgi:hypothetical protein
MHQPYKDDIKRIAQDMMDCEPEVGLAIKVPPIASSTISPSQEVDEIELEDDSEVDTFLSSHGFEYIDATEEGSLSSKSDEGKGIHSEGKAI